VDTKYKVDTVVVFSSTTNRRNENDWCLATIDHSISYNMARVCVSFMRWWWWLLCSRPTYWLWYLSCFNASN